jgi:cell division protein YceG involved in septum cleavage
VASFLRALMVMVIVVALSVACVSTALTSELTRRPAPARILGDETSGVPKEIALTIAEGETVAEIAHKLRANGLIRDTLLFRLIALQQGLGEAVQPGTYPLRHGMSMQEIIEALQVAPASGS